MLVRLLEWVAFALVFALGFFLGTYLQHRHDRKRFAEIGRALKAAALDRMLHRSLTDGRHDAGRAPPLNLVKGFDDDD